MRPLIAEAASATGSLLFENIDVGTSTIVIGPMDPLQKVEVRIGELTGHLVLSQVPSIRTDQDGYGVEFVVRLYLDEEPTLSQLMQMFYKERR